ncbi:hypothetical protein HYD43_03220 [Mycoplasmopsis bovis]|nr:hypothetical protein [Mycoplasmopsis bovis]QQH83882.1 hypothetical protein HYD43_03220 [Mycoplasmopsis bovis]
MSADLEIDGFQFLLRSNNVLSYHITIYTDWNLDSSDHFLILYVLWMLDYRQLIYVEVDVVPRTYNLH